MHQPHATHPREPRHPGHDSAGTDDPTNTAAPDQADATADAVIRDHPTAGASDSPGRPASRPEAVGLRALFIPADPGAPVRTVDLYASGSTVLAAAYLLMGCSMVEVLEPADDVTFLVDEEGSPLYQPGAVCNDRATYLVHAVLFAQATGEYPADAAGGDPIDRLRTAVAWQRRITVYGDVLVVGFDPARGRYRAVADPFVTFAAETLGLDLR